jgi:hypothetical protein
LSKQKITLQGNPCNVLKSLPFGEVRRGFGGLTTYEEGYARCVFVPQKPCACPAGTFHRSGEKLDFSCGKRFKTMRPKTASDDKLGEGVRVRMTELEKKLLLRRSKKEGYLTLSSFCRAKLVRKREIKKIEASKDFVQITQKLDYELNKIGVNLNQVSKNLNTHPVYQFSNTDREVFKAILLELKNCFAILQEYLNKIEPK